jgi:type IV pilus assembly protein PilA
MYILFVINYQKLMKNKGFTLIELLVVVAIIGILAAIGVVSFSGFTESAKVSATKQIHVQTIKYAKAEIMKCKLGAATAMDGYLSCTASNPGLFASNVMGALTNVSALRVGGIDYGVLKDSKNPYDSSLPALRSRDEYTPGQVSIAVIGTNLQIKTCFKTGCAAENTTLVLVSTTD